MPLAWHNHDINICLGVLLQALEELGANPNVQMNMNKTLRQSIE